MATSIANLAVILSANSAQLGQDLDRAKSMVGQFGGQINKDFDKAGDHIAKMWRKLDPTEIKRQAGIELLKEELEGRHKKELAAAKERMVPTVEAVGPTLQEQAAEVLRGKAERKKLDDEVKRQSIASQPLQAPMAKGLEPSAVGRMGRLGFNLGEPLFGAKSQITQSMGKMGMGLDSVVTGLAKFGPHVAIASAALAGTAAAAIAFHQAAISFASFANPAAAMRYQRAWDDLTAVIGSRLVPYLNFATDVVRLFGDFLQTILPSANEVEQIFKELKPLLEEFRDLLAAIAPVIKAMIQPALDMAKGGAKFAAWLASGLTPIIGAIGGGKKLESSVGMAPRAAHFVGIEELSKQNIAMGFSQGRMDPAKETANNTERLVQQNEGILEKLGNMTGQLAASLMAKVIAGQVSPSGGR